MPHTNDTLKSETETFINWANGNLHTILTLDLTASFEDLRPLGKMIGDASVVSLSEPAHYSLEPLQFRNRVVRYLIEECGFTDVALESGVVEGRLLYDYVRGAQDDFAAAISDGLSWTFDRLTENEDLVRWMRHYNDAKPKEQMVHLYGMDVPGSPANTFANRGVDTALVEALRFVARVEPTEAAPLIQRCMPILELLDDEVLKAGNGTGYLQLPNEDRVPGRGV